MAKLTTCKTCNKEVAKSAKKCPHCGAKLKVGFFTKLMLIVIVMVGIGIYNTPSAPSKEEKIKQLKTIASLKPSNLQPGGEIAEMFSIGSDYTDLQREVKEKEVTGKVVDWVLPVYEVRLSDKENRVYTVQTSSTSNTVGTYIKVHAINDTDEAFMQNLKTGNTIHIKGTVKNINSFRSFEINPAILVR